MQPTHCCEFTRADHTDNWSRRLGEERASHAFRCRDLWDSGARVVLGSDWPIAPYPPLAVMAGARHRRPSRDLTEPPPAATRPWPLQALQGFTLNPAWVPGEEQPSGATRHRPPRRPHRVRRQPPQRPHTDLARLPIILTVLDGRPTHRAPTL